jgi:hypothetical protein
LLGQVHSVIDTQIDRVGGYGGKGACCASASWRRPVAVEQLEQVLRRLEEILAGVRDVSRRIELL